MRKLLLFLITAACGAATLPLYIDTDTNTVVSPDAPTTLAGYGVASTAENNFIVGDGVGGWVEESGETAQTSLGIINANTGVEIGAYSSTTIGGAIGSSTSTSGGAIGYAAVTTTGGAVGDEVQSTTGGVIGSFAGTTTGGAVGESAGSTTGGAVGYQASTVQGGAVGEGAESFDGFAGGFSAIASGSGSVQLGMGTNSTNSTIQFLNSGSVTAAEFGRLSSNVRTVTTTNSTALISDYAILANNAAGVSITLPLAASVPSNYSLSIKNISASGSVTIDGNASETIDGALTATLTTQYESVTLVTDGSNWFIL